jgi:hypothetical protein
MDVKNEDEIPWYVNVSTLIVSALLISVVVFRLVHNYKLQNVPIVFAVLVHNILFVRLPACSISRAAERILNKFVIMEF